MQPARKDMGEKLKNGNRTNLNLQNLIILSCIILIYLILANIPNSGGALPVSGQKELAIMVCVIIAWIFEIVPIGTAAMLALMMQVPLGILDLDSVMTNFAQTILFFVIGCFCIAAGMKRCGLGNRLMLLITKSAKGCPNKMLLLFMFLAAIISMFISDLAITAMLFPIAVAILKKNNMEAGKSNYGKAVMLGIPMAALIGGIGTPAGAPMNYLALSLMEQAVGMKVTFAQWCCIGIPIVVILIPICWFVITRCYKCEVEHLIGSEEAEKDLKSLGKLTINEWKFIPIFLITLVFWITEWLPLPVTSFLGGAMFFLPGIELNDVSVIKNDVDWNVLMLNVCSAALGVGVMQTGGAAWLAQGVLGGIGGLNTVVMILLIAAFTAAIQLVIPVNTALVSILVPTVANLAVTLGISPALMVLPVAFTTSCSLLLPLDTVPALTLSSGYYKMTDMLKPGAIVSSAWVIVQTIVVFALIKPLGF